MTGVAVRPLAVADLAAAARLHAALLPHGFFVSLGLRYLRAYYGTFLASPHAIGLAADLEGQPVGVLVGTSRNAAHYRWVIRHRGLRLAVLGASAMLVRPAVAAWFLPHAPSPLRPPRAARGARTRPPGWQTRAH